MVCLSPICAFLQSLFWAVSISSVCRRRKFSGFAGAVGGAAIYAIIAMRGRVFAYMGGIALARGARFGQAIIAEVIRSTRCCFYYFGIVHRPVIAVGRASRICACFVLLRLFMVWVWQPYPILVNVGLLITDRISFPGCACRRCFAAICVDGLAF